MAQKKSLYEILGVAPDASDSDIREAYQAYRQQLADGAQQDALVRQSFEMLINPNRRAAYDASLVTATEKAAAAQQAQAPDLVTEDTGEEGSQRPQWVVPAIVAGVIVVIAAFMMMRSRPAEKAAPPPVVEAPKPITPAPPQPLRAEQILPAAIRATGRVLSYDMTGAAVPLGIGVSLEPGSVITTCHGMAAGSKLVFKQGSEMLSADLLVVDELLDLCKLTVPGLQAKSLEIAADEPRVGDKVFALGMNAKGDFALTEGTVKELKIVQGTKVLDLSVPIAAGASGGAVLDSFGRVVGIATTPHRYGAGVNAAISSAWISQMRSRARPQ